MDHWQGGRRCYRREEGDGPETVTEEWTSQGKSNISGTNSPQTGGQCSVMIIVGSRKPSALCHQCTHSTSALHINNTWSFADNIYQRTNQRDRFKHQQQLLSKLDVTAQSINTDKEPIRVLTTQQASAFTNKNLMNQYWTKVCSHASSSFEPELRLI